jgi:hypothetical protein
MPQTQPQNGGREPYILSASQLLCAIATQRAAAAAPIPPQELHSSPSSLLLVSSLLSLALPLCALFCSLTSSLALLFLSPRLPALPVSEPPPLALALTSYGVHWSSSSRVSSAIVAAQSSRRAAANKNKASCAISRRFLIDISRFTHKKCTHFIDRRRFIVWDGLW